MSSFTDFPGKTWNLTLESGSVTISWQKIFGADTYLAACTDTNMEPDPDSEAWTDVGDVASVTFDNLTIGQKYHFWIKAKNSSDGSTSPTVMISGNSPRCLLRISGIRIGIHPGRHTVDLYEGGTCTVLLSEPQAGRSVAGKEDSSQGIAGYYRCDLARNLFAREHNI